MTLDQISRAFKVEEFCRAAFDGEFPNGRPTMTYEQWRIAFKTGWRKGKEDTMWEWADHMARMAEAVK